MKNEKLFELLGEVDDEFVAELYEREARVREETKTVRPFAWRKYLAAAACLAIVILAAVLWPSAGSETPVPPQQQILTAVIVDVNPSVELSVGEDGKISSAAALNDDAAALLDGIELAGLECGEGAQRLVAALKAAGYLTPGENSVLVSALGRGDAAQAAGESVSRAIEAAGAQEGLSLAVVSQVVEAAPELSEKAAQYGISVGKAALIDELMPADGEYNFSQLADLSIHSLTQILQCVGAQTADIIGEAAGAVTDAISDRLGLGEIGREDSFDLAYALARAYEGLPDGAHGYDIDLDGTTAPDGSREWTITFISPGGGQAQYTLSARAAVGAAADAVKQLTDGAKALADELIGAVWR